MQENNKQFVMGTSKNSNKFYRAAILIPIIFAIFFSIFILLDNIPQCFRATYGICKLQIPILFIFLIFSYICVSIFRFLSRSNHYKNSKILPIFLIILYTYLAIIICSAPYKLMDSNTKISYQIRTFIIEHKWISNDSFDNGNSNILYRN